MSTSLGFQEYVWTNAETLETLVRGLWFDRTHDYCGRVRQFYDANDELWILKSINHSSSEVDILRTLASHPSPSNHTFPTEIISCDDTYLLLMPCCHPATSVAWRSIDEILNVTGQYLQGLHFMHQLGIAHLDLHAENLIYARDPHNAVGDLAVQEGRAYFIDFGISNRFPPLSGFTNGTTTTPFEEGLGHYPPPEGIEAVNPYAYDMYCMGWVIRHISWRATILCNYASCPSVRVTPAVWAFAFALASNDPNERPSALHASSLMRLLQLWIKMTRWLYWLLPYHRADGIELCGWYIINWIVHGSGLQLRKLRDLDILPRSQTPPVRPVRIFV